MLAKFCFLALRPCFSVSKNYFDSSGQIAGISDAQDERISHTLSSIESLEWLKKPS